MIYSNKNVFFDKVVNRILVEKNRMWSVVSPTAVCRSLKGKKWSNAHSFNERLSRVVGDYSHFSTDNLSAENIALISKRAEYSYRHHFELLGSKMSKLDPIDWHIDFIHNYSWKDKQYYRKYPLISTDGGRDIKVVWDFNRCHHLLWMGEAYLISNDKKYASEIVAEIDDWIENNPLMFSVNWTCSMDVAIRAVNWIYSLSMISSSGLISDEFASKVENSLYEHMFFIINNLEKTIPNSGNHYLSDLTGLIFITTLFPDNRFAKMCRQFAIKEFYRETLIELNKDGSSYENSVSYHRLVTELFLYTYIALIRQGYEVPKNVATRIKRATGYVGKYTKQSGLAPLIGDNDNGQLLPFVPRDYRYHSYLQDIGKYIFANGNSGSVSELAFLNPIRTFLTDDEDDTDVYDTGLAIISNHEAQLFVNNSLFSFNRGEKLGENAGTHTHCDNLSFEFCLGEDDFFVDPGCYVYTSDPVMRNKLRSTKSHNALTVDNESLGGYSKTSVFLMRQHLSHHSLKRYKTNETDTVEGSFIFNNGTLQYSQQRRFDLESHSLVIKDVVAAMGTHTATLHFVLHPNIQIDERKDSIVLMSRTYEVEMEVTNRNHERVAPIISSWCYSPSYGVLNDTKRIDYCIGFTDTTEFYTQIKWKRR